MEDEKPKQKNMVQEGDRKVCCAACGKTGAYYKMTDDGLKKIGATLRRTDMGYMHEDCLA